jgi:hypothetical protein
MIGEFSRRRSASFGELLLPSSALRRARLDLARKLLELTPVDGDGGAPELPLIL